MPSLFSSSSWIWLVLQAIWSCFVKGHGPKKYFGIEPLYSYWLSYQKWGFILPALTNRTGHKGRLLQENHLFHPPRQVLFVVELPTNIDLDLWFPQQSEKMPRHLENHDYQKLRNLSCKKYFFTIYISKISRRTASGGGVLPLCFSVFAVATIWI